MTNDTVVCYFCGKGSPARFRRMACPCCGKRLPGVPAKFALGEKPQDSLRSLIIWGWVFVGLTIVSGVMAGLLRGHSPQQVGSAPTTFAYTSLTSTLIGAVIAPTLFAANIGTSRWHGLAALAVLAIVCAIRCLGK